jgi:hypothetical protein
MTCVVYNFGNIYGKLSNRNSDSTTSTDSTNSRNDVSVTCAGCVLWALQRGIVEKRHC